jgi:hypothetical protein
MKRYENFVGLTEVKAAQHKVVEVKIAIYFLYFFLFYKAATLCTYRYPGKFDLTTHGFRTNLIE